MSRATAALGGAAAALVSGTIGAFIGTAIADNHRKNNQIGSLLGALGGAAIGGALVAESLVGIKEENSVPAPPRFP